MEIEINKFFIYIVEVIKFYEENLRGIGRYIIICFCCNFICYENCVFVNDDDKCFCCVMGLNGNCIVCIKYCYWLEYKNFLYIIRYKKEIEIRILDDLKMKYEMVVLGKIKV